MSILVFCTFFYYVLKLCIPVVHHGCWSLYAFNISDKKLSILDPAPERAFNMSYQKLGAVDPTSVTGSSVGRLLVARPESEHENSRLKICKALEFVKDNFNLFKNASGKFSSWRYEFTDLGQLRETSSLPPLLPSVFVAMRTLGSLYSTSCVAGMANGLFIQKRFPK